MLQVEKRKKGGRSPHRKLWIILAILLLIAAAAADWLMREDLSAERQPKTAGKPGSRLSSPRPVRKRFSRFR